MRQLSVSLVEKIDAPLAELCNGTLTASQARMPVIVRYREGTADALVDRITALGGQVRHNLEFIRAISAWLPLESVEPLARHSDVEQIELDQQFTIA